MSINITKYISRFEKISNDNENLIEENVTLSHQIFKLTELLKRKDYQINTFYQESNTLSSINKTKRIKECMHYLINKHNNKGKNVLAIKLLKFLLFNIKKEITNNNTQKKFVIENSFNYNLNGNKLYNYTNPNREKNTKYKLILKIIFLIINNSRIRIMKTVYSNLFELIYKIRIKKNKKITKKVLLYIKMKSLIMNNYMKMKYFKKISFLKYKFISRLPSYNDNKHKNQNYNLSYFTLSYNSSLIKKTFNQLNISNNTLLSIYSNINKYYLNYTWTISSDITFSLFRNNSLYKNFDISTSSFFLQAYSYNEYYSNNNYNNNYYNDNSKYSYNKKNRAKSKKSFTNSNNCKTYDNNEIIKTYDVKSTNTDLPYFSNDNYKEIEKTTNKTKKKVKVLNIIHIESIEIQSTTITQQKKAPFFELQIRESEKLINSLNKEKLFLEKKIMKQNETNNFTLSENSSLKIKIEELKEGIKEISQKYFSQKEIYTKSTKDYIHKEDQILELKKQVCVLQDKLKDYNIIVDKNNNSIKEIDVHKITIEETIKRYDNELILKDNKMNEMEIKLKIKEEENNSFRIKLNNLINELDNEKKKNLIILNLKNKAEETALLNKNEIDRLLLEMENYEKLFETYEMHILNANNEKNKALNLLDDENKKYEKLRIDYLKILGNIQE